MAALPFECVRGFLESSDVVRSARVAPEAVHKAFVELLRKDKDASAPSASRDEKPRDEKPPHAATFVCACGCTTYLVDDTRADRICADCGRAHYGFVYSNCTVYNDKAGAPARREPKPSHAPYHTHGGPAEQDDEIRREVEHWNEAPYGPHMGTDELARAKRWANAVTHASVTVKAVSALLFHKVNAAFDPKELESAMRQGRPMPTLVAETVRAYACPRCGAEVDTPYAAKRHPCGWGVKRRRRL